MRWRRACYAMALSGVHILGGGCSPEAEAPGNTAQRTAPAATAAPAPAPAPQSAPAPTDDDALVLAFGDSLYAGYGLAPDESFPAQLERALREGGTMARVHNAGVSGDTSATGLERFQFTLDGLPRTPDLAIVGLGGNDMLRGLDPAITKRNLRAICEQLKERGIKVVLTGMLAAPNLGQDYARRFNALFPEVARECGASLDPFFLQDVVTDPGLMLPDRIHPNRDGIARIVRRLRPTIARALTTASENAERRAN